GSPCDSNDALVGKAMNTVVTEAQFLQQADTVLTKFRHLAHARREGIAASWRQEYRQRAGRRGNLCPALACHELWMLPDVMHVVDMGVGDIGIFQPGDNLIGAEFLKGMADQVT